MTLFKRAAVFTDIHFGLKSNSNQHNEDCARFVDWFIAKAKEENCETCIFLGDWHNNRANLNIVTLQYSLRALEKLNEAFSNVYFIPGNHDLYYRDKRDVQSVEWAKHLSNVHICNDWVELGGCVIAPWLVQEDWKRLKGLTGKYLFGHFELPNFYMNAMVQMPDHGEIQVEQLSGFEKVFSGHFHKRQSKNNVWYIGNAFPHNFADAGDDDRGMMVLEWDKEPEFHSWPDQPKYRVFRLSDVLEDPDRLLKPGSYVRIQLDIDISYEEANYIKDKFIPEYQLRECALIPMKLEQAQSELGPEDLKFESVDQIIIDQINELQDGVFDKRLLLEIYNSL